MKKLIKWYRKRLLETKIKQANKNKKLTGYKYMVVMWGGCMRVLSKQHIKKMIKRKMLSCTIQDIEKAALYITK